MSDNDRRRARVTFDSWVMPSHEPGIQMVQVGGSWFAFDSTAPGVSVEWLPPCNGICITAAEVGVIADGVAYAHPDCELHGGIE
ncbi:MAG TPA: hypothetical protein VJL80_14515 [Aeromicrobium sp.]|nr:hypothetical protein [Aeromicrobium sp.]HKY59247.1 hypothetical protein [Aeromicrobium sp.]